MSGQAEADPGRACAAPVGPAGPPYGAVRPGVDRTPGRGLAAPASYRGEASASLVGSTVNQFSGSVTRRRVSFGRWQ